MLSYFLLLLFLAAGPVISWCLWTVPFLPQSSLFLLCSFAWRLLVFRINFVLRPVPFCVWRCT